MPRRKTTYHIQARLNRDNGIEARAIENYEAALAEARARGIVSAPRHVIASVLYGMNPLEYADNDSERLAGIVAESVANRVATAIAQQNEALARRLLDAIADMGYRVVSAADVPDDARALDDDDDELAALLENMSKRMGVE